MALIFLKGLGNLGGEASLTGATPHMLTKYIVL